MMDPSTPSSNSPREQVHSLVSRKEVIEAEINTQVSILKANNSTLQSPLVDGEGFPRDDIGMCLISEDVNDVPFSGRYLPSAACTSSHN